MRRAGRTALILICVFVFLILLFWIWTSGLYTESGAPEPDAFRIAGPVLSRRHFDGELDFRAFFLVYPDFSGPLGRLRIVTPFGGDYPARSSELLYYDLFARRVVLSSLAYDYGVVEQEYRRG